MINHARVLLINRPCDGSIGLPGDEYIPPRFKPVGPLPSYLKGIRQILFGPSPDRIFGNFRARQFTALLHATELIQFVRQLDTRITYDVDNDDLFNPDVFGLKVSSDGLSLVGTPTPPDATGKSFQRWRLTVEDSNTAKVIRVTSPSTEVETDFTVTDGVSSPVPLPGSGVSATFYPNVGQSWDICGYIRPAASLTAIVNNLRNANGGHINELFGVGSLVGATEPFKTFMNLWLDHPEQAYHLGGLLLAVIYRMDSMRTDGAAARTWPTTSLA